MNRTDHQVPVRGWKSRGNRGVRKEVTRGGFGCSLAISQEHGELVELVCLEYLPRVSAGQTDLNEVNK